MVGAWWAAALLCTCCVWDRVFARIDTDYQYLFQLLLGCCSFFANLHVWWASLFSFPPCLSFFLVHSALTFSNWEKSHRALIGGWHIILHTSMAVDICALKEYWCQKSGIPMTSKGTRRTAHYSHIRAHNWKKKHNKVEEFQKRSGAKRKKLLVPECKWKSDRKKSNNNNNNNKKINT